MVSMTTLDESYVHTISCDVYNCPLWQELRYPRATEGRTGGPRAHAPDPPPPCSVFVCELGSWPGGNGCLQRGGFTEHWLFITNSFAPREHLATSGDILDCHNLPLAGAATKL